MRVMVLVKATSSSEAGELPSAELLQAMDKFNQELVGAGIMLAGEGLKPTSAGYRVRFEGTQRLVTTGPFAETHELVAGYWIWEVASLEEAVAWVKRCPNPMPEASEIEIRPLYEMADFAPLDPDGSIATSEEKMRQQIALRNCNIQPYLFFSGQCEQALEFYQQALGAKVTALLRFNESPDPVPEGMLQAGFENKIMHAAFTVGQVTIMASDGCDDRSRFAGFRLALSLESVDQCHTAFDALAQDGTVDMPLTKTFWSPLYGMVTDRFGVAWMVMVSEDCVA